MTHATTTNHGKELAAFLQREWDDLGVTRGEWCRMAGIADSTVMRWKAGTAPDISNLRAIADALGRSLPEILIAGRYMTEEESRGLVVRRSPPPSMRDTIARDPDLTDVEREVLRQMLDGVLMLREGKSAGRRA